MPNFSSLKRRAVTASLTLGMVLGISSGSALAGYDEGIAAYDRKDYPTAFKELQLPAVRGDLEAQFRLGRLYDEGWGVAINDALAAAWYERAAEQGNSAARYNLALMHLDGEGIPQDRAQAFALMSGVAEEGDSAAQHVLGRMYLNGWGTDKDEVLARHWLTRAANAGHENAAKLLAELPPPPPVIAAPALPEPSPIPAGDTEADADTDTDTTELFLWAILATLGIILLAGLFGSYLLLVRTRTESGRWQRGKRVFKRVLFGAQALALLLVLALAYGEDEFDEFIGYVLLAMSAVFALLDLSALWALRRSQGQRGGMIRALLVAVLALELVVFLTPAYLAFSEYDVLAGHLLLAAGAAYALFLHGGVLLCRRGTASATPAAAL